MDDDLTRLPESETPQAALLGEGSDFGPYRIVGLLGRGGMGEVYEAEHRDLHTRHALKLINPEIVDRSDAKERFKREARVMARLRHLNIVHVDDFGELDGRIWLRMDLMDGWSYQGKTYHSLQDLMREQGALPEPLVRRLLGEILDGLGFAHEAGAVHRDLKPANLLFDEEGRVKITDFGLVSLAGADWLQSQVQLTVARSMADPDATRLEMEGSSAGTSTQALLGTYAYMSPEQKKGSEVDARSDLYSVGLIGFQMLTGEETPGFEMPSDLVEDLDPAWDQWVKQAMAVKIQSRYPDARSMLPRAKNNELVDVKEQANAPRRKFEVSNSLLPKQKTERVSILDKSLIRMKIRYADPIELIKIPSGKFLMGSVEASFFSPDRRVRKDDEIQHEVVITKPFWLSKFPITQGQWSAVTHANPSAFKNLTENLPIDSVNWHEAMEFCKDITREKSESLPEGFSVSLPTEAQWEYACRGGTTTPFNSGADFSWLAAADPLYHFGWYSANSKGRPHGVGQKEANSFGLHDMHGNVWEWCYDVYRPYNRDRSVDPVERELAGEDLRVYRGGSWASKMGKCRSSHRNAALADKRGNNLGFRVCLSNIVTE